MSAFDSSFVIRFVELLVKENQCPVVFTYESLHDLDTVQFMTRYSDFSLIGISCRCFFASTSKQNSGQVRLYIYSLERLPKISLWNTLALTVSCLDEDTRIVFNGCN